MTPVRSGVIFSASSAQATHRTPYARDGVAGVVFALPDRSVEQYAPWGVPIVVVVVS